MPKKTKKSKTKNKKKVSKKVKSRINKKVFMFDHFRGLRHFQKKDGNKAKFLKGSYLGNKKPIKELINFFKFKNIYFIDKDATKLKNNFFGKQKFSMAIIDVDLYEPTKKILGALCDDLNLPLVLTEMHNLLKVEDLAGFVNSMAFLGFNSIGAKNIINTNSNLVDHISLKLINDLISSRQNARVNKDYKKSDEIRIRLEKAGVSIKDLEKETKWTLKPFFNPKKLLEEN